ncbi:MAG: NAD(P)/FAD-dependent oxidoreductase, partial [Pseudomonadota bacterium]|nr:NAD(P)/FAD-dependent oxidoreductase [Pseudomonadota bacterium]
VPNSDLFKAIKNGSVEVVTDEIDTVTSDGVQLKSGMKLPADILVTATGLKLSVLADVPFTIDGQAIDFSSAFTYRGMMYSEVPNLVSTFGYINASWTLRADLTSEWACRLLRHMDNIGADRVIPQLREEDDGMRSLPWIDNFPAGYMRRAMHLFPKQGSGPWRNTQDFLSDRKMLRKGPIADGTLVFSSSKNDEVEFKDPKYTVSVG